MNYHQCNNNFSHVKIIDLNTVLNAKDNYYEFISTLFIIHKYFI